MKFRTWADYFYPGTQVLRNKQNIRDAARLREFEEDSAFLRMSEILVKNPIPGELDRAHMSAIHRHIFGDVYEWAGHERTAPPFPQQMTKDGPSPDSIAAGRYDADEKYGYPYFPAGEAMTEHFDLWVRRLHGAGNFANMKPREFAEAIGEPWGEMNVAHLFREGNTRTQVAFFTYFAREHGHALDYARFSEDVHLRLKFNAGRFLIQANKGPGLLIDCIAEVLDRSRPMSTAPVSPPQPSRSEAKATPDDYQPHYVSRNLSGRPRGAGECGAPTAKGSPCQRPGRCPYHG